MVNLGYFVLIFELEDLAVSRNYFGYLGTIHISGGDFCILANLFLANFGEIHFFNIILAKFSVFSALKFAKFSTS